MASAFGLALFVGLLGLHTVVAAVMTRFFRIRLSTRVGWVLYSLLVTPFVLLASTLFFTGPLGIGPNLGSPATVVGVLIGVPLALGFTIDVLYVPPPEEYDLPETTR